MVFGRSGGVRGHGMDHTRRLPRTLAGFGLTWHGGSRFSCFWEILETHFITKYLPIGPRASRLVLGFVWKPGHHLRSYKTNSFSCKLPLGTYFLGKLENIKKTQFVDTRASFFMFFFGPHGARDLNTEIAEKLGGFELTTHFLFVTNWPPGRCKAGI